jgi:hypothetical protein
MLPNRQKHALPTFPRVDRPRIQPLKRLYEWPYAPAGLRPKFLGQGIPVAGSGQMYTPGDTRHDQGGQPSATDRCQYPDTSAPALRRARGKFASGWQQLGGSRPLPSFCQVTRMRGEDQRALRSLYRKHRVRVTGTALAFVIEPSRSATRCVGTREQRLMWIFSAADGGGGRARRRSERTGDRKGAGTGDISTGTEKERGSEGRGARGLPHPRFVVQGDR